MKKRLLFAAQIVLFGLFSFCLVATILQFSETSNPLKRFDQEEPVYNNTEAFTPAFSRLNTIKKVEQFCDSIYAEKIVADNSLEFEKTYVDIVFDAIKNRFYHGYSSFGFGNNYVSYLISSVTVPGLSAPVLPDDILKFPYAACSQQAIVMMEVLAHKGFKTRKVTFQGKLSGHFAFEVYYDNAWHFNDPNLEPDIKILDSYGRPGIDFLAKNTSVLLRAYGQYTNEKVLDVFHNYSYGPINEFPAGKAAFFQRVTGFLSYTIWLFFLAAFLLVRRKYLRISKSNAQENNRIAIPLIQPEAAPVYYPDYKAQGA